MDEERVAAAARAAAAERGRTADARHADFVAAIRRSLDSTDSDLKSERWKRRLVICLIVLCSFAAICRDGKCHWQFSEGGFFAALVFMAVLAAIATHRKKAEEESDAAMEDMAREIRKLNERLANGSLTIRIRPEMRVRLNFPPAAAPPG